MWIGKVMMVIFVCNGDMCSKTVSITTPQQCRDTADVNMGADGVEVHCLKIK